MRLGLTVPPVINDISSGPSLPPWQFRVRRGSTPAERELDREEGALGPLAVSTDSAPRERERLREKISAVRSKHVIQTNAGSITLLGIPRRDVLVSSLFVFRLVSSRASPFFLFFSFGTRTFPRVIVFWLRLQDNTGRYFVINNSIQECNFCRLIEENDLLGVREIFEWRCKWRLLSTMGGLPATKLILVVVGRTSCMVPIGDDVYEL